MQLTKKQKHHETLDSKGSLRQLLSSIIVTESRILQIFH